MSVQRFFERLRGVSSEPEYLTALPAAVSDDFPLRRSQEEKLYRALCRRGRQILLYAPGGMGKTHMARKLFYRLRGKYKRMAWITYGSGIRESMTMPQMDQVSINPDVRFSDFIRALEEEPNTILFIDDAKETAVDDLVLAQLTGLDITILMTSRCQKIEPYESWKLEPITNRECVELFYANYSRDAERKYQDAVSELADRMERNVFAMRLLASVVGESRWLPRLAKAMDQGNLMDHIGQLIDFFNLAEAQQGILRCLSLVPSREIPEGLVDWFQFPNEELEALVDKGWLIRDRKAEVLILHDLIREYYYRGKLDRKSIKVFVRSFMGEDFNLGFADHASAVVKGKVLEMQMRAVELMVRCGSSQKELAQAYTNLGLGFCKIGNYWNALKYLSNALEIWKRILPEEPLNVAASYNDMGNAYGGFGRREEQLNYYRKALEIREKNLPPDNLDLADTYHNIAWVYTEEGEYQTALEWEQRAYEIAECVLPKEHQKRKIHQENMEYLKGKIS